MRVIHREEILGFDCPGCKTRHWVNIEDALPIWSWNGDVQLPTLMPSVHVVATPRKGVQHTVCHSYVQDGRIQFLSDCAHDLKGQTVDLPDVDPSIF